MKNKDRLMLDKEIEKIQEIVEKHFPKDGSRRALVDFVCINASKKQRRITSAHYKEKYGEDKNPTL